MTLALMRRNAGGSQGWKDLCRNPPLEMSKVGATRRLEPCGNTLVSSTPLIKGTSLSTLRARATLVFSCPTPEEESAVSPALPTPLVTSPPVPKGTSASTLRSRASLALPRPTPKGESAVSPALPTPLVSSPPWPKGTSASTLRSRASLAQSSPAVSLASASAKAPDVVVPPGAPPILHSASQLSIAAHARWTQHGMDGQLRAMEATARRLFPHLRGDAQMVSRLRSLCLRAYEMTDHEFAAKEAQEWADGYVVPPAYVEEDEADLHRHRYDLEALARERLARLAHNRLSVERVRHVLTPSNPEYKKMLQLAKVGITVHVDPDFVPNLAPHAPGRPPSFSKGYLSAPNAVNKCEVDLFRGPGLALIFRNGTIPKLRRRETPIWTHTSKFGWAPKHGKKCGRPTTDASSAGKGNVPLNTPHVKEAGDRQWGEIHHPSIRQWALTVLEFVERATAADPAFTMADVVQWKMDLNGAFSLLNFRVEDVRLMANEMTNGLTIFHLCGQFGWTGTPAAFQVVTRALAWELVSSPIYAVTGLCLLYVDDIWGICLNRHLASDLATCRQLCEDLLGQGAIAEHKTVTGTRLPVIGFELDLDSMQMCIMDKNVLKAAYAYLSINMDQPVPVRDMMRLASYASRYAAICVEMRPLIRALYTAFRGLGVNTSISVERMPEDARRSVQILRLLILLSSVDELHFSRTLGSFVKTKPACTVEFDGCLHGAGILLFDVDGDGDEVLVGGAAIDLTALDFDDDSSNQNLSEFLAGPVLGVRALYKWGRTPCAIRLRGDSKTALSWADKGSFRSDRVLNAATIFIVQCQLLGVTVTHSQHLPKERNTAADFLSRTRDSVPLLAGFMCDDMYLGLKKVDVEESELLALCDPRLVASSDRDFEALWGKARRAILS